MATPTDMQPRKPRASTRIGPRPAQAGQNGRLTKPAAGDQSADEDRLDLLEVWGADLSVGEIGVLRAIIMDFRANGSRRVAVPLRAYAARLALTVAALDTSLDRLAEAGAIEILERLCGSAIVRPLSRAPSSDFARAASRLRPARVARHRVRPARPAA